MKIKIKSHVDEVTNFYDKEVSKVSSNYTCPVVMNLRFALNKDGNYFPLVSLKERKCIEKKVIRHINDIVRESFSDDVFDDSDEE